MILKNPRISPNHRLMTLTTFQRTLTVMGYQMTKKKLGVKILLTVTVTG